MVAIEKEQTTSVKIIEIELESAKEEGKIHKETLHNGKLVMSSQLEENH